MLLLLSPEQQFLQQKAQWLETMIQVRLSTASIFSAESGFIFAGVLYKAWPTTSHFQYIVLDAWILLQESKPTLKRKRGDTAEYVLNPVLDFSIGKSASHLALSCISQGVALII